MNTFLVSIYILVTLFESIYLYRNNKKKELNLYLPTMIVSVILIILIMNKIEIPSPTKMIESLINII